MKALKDILVESQHSIKTVDELKRLLDKFPNDATSWKDATDEVRDIARDARELLSELDNIELEPVDFRLIKNPAEWNTKAKEFIFMAIEKMSKNTLKRFLEYQNKRF